MNKQTGRSSALEGARASSSRTLLGIVLGGGALVLVAGLLLVFGSSAIRPKTEPAKITVQPDECSPAALATNPSACVPRENYVNAARTLRTQLYPQLAAISFELWSPDALDEIQQLEQAALENFDLAEYTLAEETISQAVEVAQQHLDRSPEVLSAALDEMVAAFDSGNAEQAKSALTQASWIDANHAKVVEYGPRIQILEQALNLLQEAKVARVENRTDPELKALEALVRLDPARTEHLPRIAEIRNQRREQAYGLAISRAEESLRKQEYTKARQFVAEAQRLEPQRDHSFLLGRIETAERDQRVLNLLSQAETASANDDWLAAKDLYGQVLAINSTHKVALSGHSDAKAIVIAKGKLTGYLSRPLRLASDRVAEFARRDLNNSQPLLSKSPQLRVLDAKVRDYLQKAAVPVTVAVVSNGATDVSVRRVGQVGKHKRKTIQLTPGLYEFEGRRNGYKSALVELEIPYGVANIEVRVEANERI